MKWINGILEEKTMNNPLKVRQIRNFCGPCALSYGVFLLTGENIPQEKIVKKTLGASGVVDVFEGGMDEDQLKKAAGKLGIRAEFLEHGGEDFEGFRKAVDACLDAGNPVMVCFDYGSITHWATIVARKQTGKRSTYYVCDPDDKRRLFRTMSLYDLKAEAFITESPEDGTHDQYFAIALSRKDGKSPAFAMTDNVMRLLDNEKYDSVASMREDLVELAREISEGAIPMQLSAYLEKVMPAVKSALEVLDWDLAEVTKAEAMGFYRDYIAVATVGRIEVQGPVNTVLLAANMTALMTTCAWNGEL